MICRSGMLRLFQCSLERAKGIHKARFDIAEAENFMPFRVNQQMKNEHSLEGPD